VLIAEWGMRVWTVTAATSRSSRSIVMASSSLVASSAIAGGEEGVPLFWTYR
jgi:hypothetical protein